MNSIRRQSCQLLTLAKSKPSVMGFSTFVTVKPRVLKVPVAQQQLIGSDSAKYCLKGGPGVGVTMTSRFSVPVRTFAADSNNPLSKEHFDMLVSNNKVVVFMKGVPDEPRCGFSNAVVQILRMHGVTDYDSHDVLQDENIRQGIKEYTSWPTIPQVFINGEFIGGCDILIEMHKNGELVQQLSKVGIKSALVDQEKKDGK